MHKKSERSSYTKLWGISQLCFSQNPEGRAGEVEEKPVFRSVLRSRCLFHCQFLTQVRPDLWLTLLVLSLPWEGDQDMQPRWGQQRDLGMENHGTRAWGIPSPPARVAG